MTNRGAFPVRPGDKKCRLQGHLGIKWAGNCSEVEGIANGTNLEEGVGGGLGMKRNNKGFTLIELLIVVAIIGIIVAIAIPNLLNAIQRAKQKKSMGDMRSIATAVEAYSVDFNRYPPPAGFSLPSGLDYPGAGSTMNQISNYVAPTYIKVVPMADGWNSWFLWNAGNNGQDYIIVSVGKDGSLVSPATFGPTTDFNSDIVYVDGQFVNYPEGVQR
jgi:type II secretion system protein G